MPFWSPDGTALGFFAGGKLKTVGVGSGDVVTLCDVSTPPRGGSWGAGDVIDLQCRHAGTPHADARHAAAHRRRCEPTGREASHAGRRSSPTAATSSTSIRYRRVAATGTAPRVPRSGIYAAVPGRERRQRHVRRRRHCLHPGRHAAAAAVRPSAAAARGRSDAPRRAGLQQRWCRARRLLGLADRGVVVPIEHEPIEPVRLVRSGRATARNRRPRRLLPDAKPLAGWHSARVHRCPSGRHLDLRSRPPDRVEVHVGPWH